MVSMTEHILMHLLLDRCLDAIKSQKYSGIFSRCYTGYGSVIFLLLMVKLMVAYKIQQNLDLRNHNLRLLVKSWFTEFWFAGVRFWNLELRFLVLKNLNFTKWTQITGPQLTGHWCMKSWFTRLQPRRFPMTGPRFMKSYRS